MSKSASDRWNDYIREYYNSKPNPKLKRQINMVNSKLKSNNNGIK